MNFLSALSLVFALLQIANAVASFDGVFKSFDKKYVVVQVESGESMRMYVTGSTKFVRDGKPAHGGDFSDGDKVTVDAERDARMNLLAVKIETAKPNAAKKP